MRAFQFLPNPVEFLIINHPQDNPTELQLGNFQQYPSERHVCSSLHMSNSQISFIRSSIDASTCSPTPPRAVVRIGTSRSVRYASENAIASNAAAWQTPG